MSGQEITTTTKTDRNLESGSGSAKIQVEAENNMRTQAYSEMAQQKGADQIISSASEKLVLTASDKFVIEKLQEAEQLETTLRQKLNSPTTVDREIKNQRHQLNDQFVFAIKAADDLYKLDANGKAPIDRILRQLKQISTEEEKLKLDAEKNPQAQELLETLEKERLQLRKLEDSRWYTRVKYAEAALFGLTDENASIKARLPETGLPKPTEKELATASDQLKKAANFMGDQPNAKVQQLFNIVYLETQCNHGEQIETEIQKADKLLTDQKTTDATEKANNAYKQAEITATQIDLGFVHGLLSNPDIQHNKAISDRLTNVLMEVEQAAKTDALLSLEQGRVEAARKQLKHIQQDLPEAAAKDPDFKQLDSVMHKFSDSTTQEKDLRLQRANSFIHEGRFVEAAAQATVIKAGMPDAENDPKVENILSATSQNSQRLRIAREEHLENFRHPFYIPSGADFKVAERELNTLIQDGEKASKDLSGAWIGLSSEIRIAMENRKKLESSKQPDPVLKKLEENRLNREILILEDRQKAVLQEKQETETRLRFDKCYLQSQLYRAKGEPEKANILLKCIKADPQLTKIIDSYNEEFAKKHGIPGIKSIDQQIKDTEPKESGWWQRNWETVASLATVAGATALVIMSDGLATPVLLSVLGRTAVLGALNYATCAGTAEIERGLTMQNLPGAGLHVINAGIEGTAVGMMVPLAASAPFLKLPSAVSGASKIPGIGATLTAIGRHPLVTGAAITITKEGIQMANGKPLESAIREGAVEIVVYPSGIKALSGGGTKVLATALVPLVGLEGNKLAQGDKLSDVTLRAVGTELPMFLAGSKKPLQLMAMIDGMTAIPNWLSLQADTVAHYSPIRMFGIRPEALPLDTTGEYPDETKLANKQLEYLLAPQSELDSIFREHGSTGPLIRESIGSSIQLSGLEPPSSLLNHKSTSLSTKR